MTDAYQRFVGALEAHGCTVIDKGDHGSASTPGHSAADRGTTFRRIDGGVVLYVHNGDKAAVLAEVGLQLSDLYDNPETTYRYSDGRKVIRYYPPGAGKKKFSQGGNKSGRALYNVENLPADRSVTVYIVEGEQDVRAAKSAGVFAVTQAQGANTPPDRADWSALSGRSVVIVQDRDEKGDGQARARAVAEHLTGRVTSAVIVEAKTGKDLSDHLAAGHGMADLLPALDTETRTESADEPPPSCPQHPTFDRTCSDCRDCDRERADWLRVKIEIAREEKFWTARPFLEHVRDYARAKQAAPWSTLGVVLARAVAATEPNIVLPALIGSHKSINLFVALVGTSGGGKGASGGAGTDAVDFVDGNGETIWTDVLPIGSGEGIAKSFQSSRDDDRPTRVLFNIDEVDTVGALGKRQGATLMPELRKVYSGEQLGFANAGKDTRKIVPAHGYRACVTVGVQPLKSEPLLADSDGGTPQRFLWLKVSDPNAQEEESEPPRPKRVHIKSWSGPRVEMDVPDVAKIAIRRHRLAVLREEDVDPLDGHRMLTCLKVASALAIIEGRTEITEEDWHLAETLMRVSDRTRSEVQRIVAEQSRRSNRARAIAVAERDEIIGNHKFDRARDRILDWLGKEAAARTVLRRKLKEDIRPNYDAAVADLIDRGLIREREVDGKSVLELVTQGLRDSGTQASETYPDQRFPGEGAGTQSGTRVPATAGGESLESPGRVPEKPGSTCGNDARVPESLSPSSERLATVTQLTADPVSPEVMNSARRKILRDLSRHAELIANDIRRPADRVYTRPGITPALQELLESGEIVSRTVSTGTTQKILYRLATTPISPEEGEGA